MITTTQKARTVPLTPGDYIMAGGTTYVVPPQFLLDVVIYKDKTGAYCAEVPALKGCHSYGDTYEEARENIREAAHLWFECMAQMPEKLPRGAKIERVAL